MIIKDDKLEQLCVDITTASFRQACTEKLIGDLGIPISEFNAALDKMVSVSQEIIAKAVPVTKAHYEIVSITL